MGAYGTENNSLILTKFLMHYLKAAVQIKGGIGSRSDYGGLANTAVHGVVLMGKISFPVEGCFGDDRMTVQRMKKVGRLIDKYIREISHDQNLKISKFLAIAESLPDSARD
ncbi:hypothetical protein NE237_002362 [Protea cynaroides]|uniref:NPH3 domain-containing protein n=1 Tax=Protea cynaroides TaxID=273540 RepID=A0A9Q0KVY2_9MAGN|nr:hypothetical protein NE237_002362 [Protea cynaroides]